jgi:peptidoglycan/xylan/chitin deacetylase (PgdA/CDA1 family)
MFYLVKSPWWLQKLYSGCVWQIPTETPTIYLSFDDGPHPEITPLVLNHLNTWKAKASFFCVGNNVVNHPDIYRRILDEGHAVGNHSFNHLNGWKQKDEDYLNDIAKAKQYIDSDLFRPPYGKITRFQLKQLAMPAYRLKTIMWTVLSGDFDNSLDDEACLRNVLLQTQSGSIVVFHDSVRAKEKMLYALPIVLEFFTEKGFRFERIESSKL